MAERGCPARVTLTMGMQAGRQWGCLAGVGQRGVGAAGPCTLHYGDALASSDMALGPLEAFCPTPHLPPLILALAGPPAPLGLALPGLEGWGGRGKTKTFMETDDLCPLGGGNGGCHGDSFSK